MKIERPQAAVPWLPSRHRHALFRLAAFARLILTPVDRCVRDETKVLAIDRDQSTIEAYAVGALMWFTVACFMTELMSRRIHPAVAAALAIPMTALLFNAAIPATATLITPLLHTIGLPRGPHNINLTSALFILAVAFAASYFALMPGWVRVPAWIFLGCIVANGVAAVVLFLLRKRVREAEERCVA